jgi:hypothetical protein
MFFIVFHHIPKCAHDSVKYFHFFFYFLNKLTQYFIIVWKYLFCMLCQVNSTDWWDSLKMSPKVSILLILISNNILCTEVPTYEDCLKSLWSHLITPSWNFVEMR